MDRNAPPRLLLWIMPFLDAALVRFLGIRPMRDGSPLRVNFYSFRGNPFTFPDGTRINRGQRVAEIHLDNHLVSHTALPMWELLGKTRSDLRFLAEQMMSGKIKDDFKAIHAVTVHHVAASRVGFLSRELPEGAFTRLTQMFLKGLLVTYHPLRKKRLSEGRTPLEAREIWMSSQELVRRYGQVPQMGTG